MFRTLQVFIFSIVMSGENLHRSVTQSDMQS